MTDDVPVVFKRKPSKPSQSSRTRPVEVAVAAGTEDGAVQESGDSPAAIALRVRKQQKARQKQKPQISFGGDDEVRVSDSLSDPMLMFLWMRGWNRRGTARWSRSRNPSSAVKSRSPEAVHLLRTLGSAPILRLRLMTDVLV